MRFLLITILCLPLVSCEESLFSGSNDGLGVLSNKDSDKLTDPLQNPITAIGTPDTNPVIPTQNPITGIAPNPLINIFSGLSKNTKLTCDHQNISTTISGPRNSSSFSFSGELCPQAYESMRIQIIVDQSGSMADADPYKLLRSPKNHCGRENAVHAVIEKIKRALANQTNEQTSDVELGLITFDTQARDEIAHTNINNFEAQMQRIGSRDLCKANVNGLENGYTNYEAALDLARQKVSSANYKNRVVVFITDGIASVSSTLTPAIIENQYNALGFYGEGNFPPAVVDLFNQAHQHGKAAADRLRNQFPENFSMFALYLNGDIRDQTQLNAKNKIAEIVNGTENEEFFVVSNASALTEAALKIAFPAVPLNTSTASFSVTNPENSENLSLSQPLTKTRADRYEFMTQSKSLVPGTNTFKVEVTDIRGKKHAGQIVVNFEPTD